MTKFFIISSSEDKASINIRNNFIDSNIFNFEVTDYNWEGNAVQQLKSISNLDYNNSKFLENNEIFLGLTDKPLVFLNDINFQEKIIDPDILIIASRHVSKTERPAFLIHPTGVWNDNIAFGGSSRQLSYISAILLKAGYLSIKKTVKDSELSTFSSDLEVSHHGPTNLDKPLVFMELGSKLKEWNNIIAGKIIALSIMRSLIKYEKLKLENSQEIGIGFGGTHYAPQFQKLIEKTNIAIAHICPKYFISSLNKDLIDQMIEKCIENVDYFIVDWKGLNSEDKKYLLPMLEEYDIPTKKIKDFSK